MKRLLLALALLTGAPVWALQTQRIPNLDVDTLTADEINGVIEVSKMATSGNGTLASPWAIAGSNPLVPALAAITATGGKIELACGYYALGNADPAVSLPILTTGTDRRQFIIQGAGRDCVHLLYSGSGSAFRYPMVNTGTPGSSYQSNQFVFRGFHVAQTSAPRTGNAFYMTYLSESIFEDLTIGTDRIDGGIGELDQGFSYGIRLEGTAGDNVTDFNRVDNCYFKGNTHAIYIQNQGDNTIISRSSFEPQQNGSGATAQQDGVEIHNSYGVTVGPGNHFNFFGKASNNSPFGALLLSGNLSGFHIVGNYFEANYPYSIYLNPSVTAPQVNTGGGTVADNSFSFNGVTGAIGINVGLNGGTAGFTGVNIHGNGFYRVTTGNTGISYRDQVKSFVEGSNYFDNVVAGAGTDRVVQRGAQGFILGGGAADNLTRPFLSLIDSTQNNGRIWLENTTTSAEASPRVQFKPGGSGARPSVSLYATAVGELYMLDDAGSAQFIVDQSGDVTAENYTAVSASVTPTAANATTYNGASIISEGATADAFEGTITYPDWTADQTIGFPNMTGALVASTLTTNNVDVANSVWHASNAVVYEGATADTFETSLVSVDPTADQTISLPNGTGAVLLSTLTTNVADAANSIWGVSNGLNFEGTTADANETTLTVTDPTADRTITFPNATGTVALTGLGAVTTANTNGVAATDTQLAQLSLPAGYLNQSNDVLTFTASGSWTAGTVSTPTMTFKIKLCTVSGCGSGTVLTLDTVTSAAATASTTQQFRLDGTVGTVSTGATGTVISHCVADLPVGTTANTIFSGVHDVNTAASSSIDLTAALFLQLSWNPSAMAGTTHTASANVFSARNNN